MLVDCTNRVNLRWDRTNPDYFGNCVLFCRGQNSSYNLQSYLYTSESDTTQMYSNVRFALDEFLWLAFTVMNYTYSGCVAQTDLLTTSPFPERLRT